MANIPYDRGEGKKKYVSIEKHQLHVNNAHAKWLSVNIERNLFDHADYGNFEHNEQSRSWTDENENMWSFENDFSVVGSQKEQFGYFENPGNPNFDWHGFPIIPFSKSRYHISENLLEYWVEEGFLDEDDIPAIINKKRIK